MQFHLHCNCVRHHVLLRVFSVIKKKIIFLFPVINIGVCQYDVPGC